MLRLLPQSFRKLWLLCALVSISLLLVSTPSTHAQNAAVKATPTPTPTPVPPPVLVPSYDQSIMAENKGIKYMARDDIITDTDPATTSQLPTAVVEIDGQPSPTSYSHDPLLALMPNFAFSMPAQIVVSGVNIALVAVLVTHLLFTVQYHFPLSRKNFYLQISSSVMLLISLGVTLHIILKQLEHKSQSWPYMFPYIGVQIPPGDHSWSVVEEVFYLLMRAVTTSLIHITHIQFLTLLFPSALEARLILWMLGPLAIVNSGMEFTALSDEADLKTSDLGDAIRNICNSTLTLLYTCALLIWGFLVNRRRAWRAGGGTAAFGGGSMGLALINTAISFTQIKYDRLWWLPNVCWTLTIWQSWLGFWWWVSSGMGIGEVEDRQERLEKKRKRDERKRRKAEKQKRKVAGLTEDEEGEGEADRASSSQVLESSINGIRRIKHRMIGDTTANTTARAQVRTYAGSTIRSRRASAETEAIELRRINISRPEVENQGSHNQDGQNTDSLNPLASVSVARSHAGESCVADDNRTTAGTASGSSDTNPTASSVPPGWLSTAARKFVEHQPNFIKARFRRLRMAHVAAARRAATEQSALREQMLHGSRNGPGLGQMMLNQTGSGRQGSETLPASHHHESAGAANNVIRGINGSHSTSSNTLGPQQGLQTSETVRGRPLEALRSEETSLDTNSTTTTITTTAVANTMTATDTNTSNSEEATSSDSPASHMSLTSIDSSSLRHRPTRTMESVSQIEHGPGQGTRSPSLLAGNWNPFTGQDRLASRDEDEWRDQEPQTTTAGNQQSLHARSDQDESDDEAEGSWLWRGGLRKMRLRDRTTYD